ncbi:Uma2 family endonuclease [Armatimonas sp.]|uniref:Uma2 family endonuclease n=1 Tax=Armatimonas sp. TaxID=1872638 RepID=UPI003753CFCD
MSALTTEPNFLMFPFGQTGQHLRLRGGLHLTDRHDFGVFCDDNKDWRIERSAHGELIIEMPTKGFTGTLNAYLGFQLFGWALQDGTGIAFDSSAGFELPNGAMRSPDAAWVRKSQLAALNDAQKQEFLPLVPEVIFELRSSSDRLAVLEAKMIEWQSVGVRLGVLLDPLERQVQIYRLGQTPQLLSNLTTLDCSPELPGFLLDSQAIFDAGL